MTAITFNLNLLEPVLASALEGDPNSGTSYPFIPGSLIRGMLIDQYLSQPEAIQEQDFATHALTRCLFLDGTTRYLPAYLRVNDGYRTLPTALSWYKDKTEQENYQVFDKASPDFDPADGLDEFEQPKPIDPQFCLLQKDEQRAPTVQLYTPHTQVSIHTQRERQAGRATETEGAVFRYEALAPGQYFTGVILLDDDKYAKQVEALLATSTSMGGSRNAGYGRVQIENIKSVTTWWETGEAPPDIVAGESFTLMLLSDLIIRDGYGQPADTLTAGMVAQALGLESEKLEPQAVYKQNGWVGGFNRKWGLPLPQTITIRTGSVFRFKTSSPIPSDTVATLLRQGLGERCGEGFGRVAINWPDEPELRVVKPIETSPSDRPKMPELTASSQNLARRMNQRLVRRDADRSLGQAISEFRMLQSPKRSQLGGLRVVIRSALAQKTVEPVKLYLGEMKPTAAQQFEKGRVSRAGSKESLLKWLNSCVASPGDIWKQIGFNPDNNAKRIGQESAGEGQTLAVEYTLRLIDGVLAKAAKVERSQ